MFSHTNRKCFESYSWAGSFEVIALSGRKSLMSISVSSLLKKLNDHFFPFRHLWGPSIIKFNFSFGRLTNIFGWLLCNSESVIFNFFLKVPVISMTKWSPFLNRGSLSKILARSCWWIMNFRFPQNPTFSLCASSSYLTIEDFRLVDSHQGLHDTKYPFLYSCTFQHKIFGRAR